jgi:hypothetical protein
MGKMTRAEAEAAVKAKRRDPIAGNASQFEIRKAAAGDDNVYQPSAGRDVVRGIQQATVPGARRDAIDDKVRRAGG